MAGLSTSELVKRLNAARSELGEMLGQEVLDADTEAGTVTIAYAPDKRFCNPMGIIQGGIIAAMLDDAAAIACIAKAGKRIGVPTLELKVSYLSAVKPGKVVTHGRVVKMGNKISFLSADLYDEAGKHLAQATATSMPVSLDMPTR